MRDISAKMEAISSAYLSNRPKPQIISKIVQNEMPNSDKIYHCKISFLCYNNLDNQSRKDVLTMIVWKDMTIDIDDMIFDGCDVIISDR